MIGLVPKEFTTGVIGDLLNRINLSLSACSPYGVGASTARVRNARSTLHKTAIFLDLPGMGSYLHQRNSQELARLNFFYFHAIVVGRFDLHADLPDRVAHCCLFVPAPARRFKLSSEIEKIPADLLDDFF